MAIKSTVELEVKSNLKGFKGEIRQATIEAQEAVRTFGEFSPEAVEAEKKLALLRDRMEDFNDRVSAVNPDKFAQVQTVVQGVARGFQAAQGAMALFGNESEDLQKTMVKLQGALALAEGLEGLGKIQQQFTAIFQGVISGAKRAFDAIKAGIGSTGIGLLVVALGSIVTYWEDIRTAIFGVSEETKKAREEQDKYNQSMKDLNRERQILQEGELAGKKSELIDLQAEQNRLNDRYVQIQKELKVIEQGRELAGVQADEAREKRLRKELQDNALRLEQLGNGEIKLYKDINALEDEKDAKDKERAKADQERQKERQQQRLIERDQVRTLTQELRVLQADEANRELLHIQQWYENARLQYAKNQDALLVLENIYNYKRQELRDKDLKNAQRSITKQVDEVKFGEETKVKLAEQTYQRQYSEAERFKLFVETNNAELIKLAKSFFDVSAELAEAFSRQDEESQKRAFNFSKAMKIASTIMSTIEGVQNAFKTAQESPITAVVPAYPFIQAGIAGAFGLAQVAKLKATKYNSQQATQQNGGGVPQMSAPQTSSSLLQQGGNEQLTQQQRVYVLEGDITRTQQRVSNNKKVSIVK
jgi:hypothetical protein